MLSFSIIDGPSTRLPSQLWVAPISRCGRTDHREPVGRELLRIDRGGLVATVSVALPEQPRRAVRRNEHTRIDRTALCERTHERGRRVIDERAGGIGARRARDAHRARLPVGGLDTPRRRRLGQTPERNRGRRRVVHDMMPSGRVHTDGAHWKPGTVHLGRDGSASPRYLPLKPELRRVRSPARVPQARTAWSGCSRSRCTDRQQCAARTGRRSHRCRSACRRAIRSGRRAGRRLPWRDRGRSAPASAGDRRGRGAGRPGQRARA